MSIWSCSHINQHPREREWDSSWCEAGSHVNMHQRTVPLILQRKAEKNKHSFLSQLNCPHNWVNGLVCPENPLTGIDPPQGASSSVNVGYNPMQGKFQVLTVAGQFIRISWNIQTSLIDHHPLLGNLTDFGIHREWNLSTNVKEKYFKWDQTKHVSKYILQSVLPLWQTRFAPCDLCPINNYPKIFPCSWWVQKERKRTTNQVIILWSHGKHFILIHFRPPLDLRSACLPAWLLANNHNSRHTPKVFIFPLSLPLRSLGSATETQEWNTQRLLFVYVAPKRTRRRSETCTLGNGRIWARSTTIRGLCLSGLGGVSPTT